MAILICKSNERVLTMLSYEKKSNLLVFEKFKWLNETVFDCNNKQSSCTATKTTAESI